MKDLEKFVEYARCAKCRSKDISSYYNKRESPIYSENGQVIIETMTRSCDDCGYTWQELPLDYKK